MTKTKPINLVLLAVMGTSLGWLLEVALISAGRRAAIPPYSFALALVAVAVIVIVLAIPVRRSVKDREHHPIDPFYATRVVILAKASSAAGGLLTGAAAGIGFFLLDRPVVAVGSVVAAAATLVAAIALTVAGLIAENMCSVPPDKGEGETETPGLTNPI